MSAGVFPARRGVDDFPDELIVKILSYVPHDEFLNVRLVNRTFNRLSKDESLWRKVDLVFPRTLHQMCQLASAVLPLIGEHLRELKITGFHDAWGLFVDEAETTTLSSALLVRIKSSCPGLKTFVIRKCRLDLDPAAFEDHLPSTLEKLEFHECRIPRTTGGPGAFMENLATLKFERSVVDLQFVCHMRSRSRLRNLSLRDNGLSGITVLIHLVQPPQPLNAGQFLKVLDLSGMGVHVMMFLREWVLENPECQVTHLYLENVALIPRRVPAHLKVEFLSVAGYHPYTEDWFDEQAFRDLHAWAGLSSMREINASACDMTQAQRNKLVTTHPNVVFDFSEQFRESDRVEL